MSRRDKMEIEETGEDQLAQKKLHMKQSSLNRSRSKGA